MASSNNTYKQLGKLVMGRFFEMPKCKPWDIVKGRRFKCCHGLGKHTRWCLKGVKTLIIPRFSEVSAEGLYDG